MGIIGKRIALIHLKPPPPTLTLTNHIPIMKFMGLMKIVISPYIWNYDKANHKQPMLRKMKENVQLIKVQPPSQLQVNPTPCLKVLMMNMVTR